MSSTRIEHDPEAGVWRWWLTGCRDGMDREGTADSWDAASLAARKAIPPLLQTKITPPAFPQKGRGRK